MTFLNQNPSLSLDDQRFGEHSPKCLQVDGLLKGIPCFLIAKDLHNGVFTKVRNN